MCSIAVDRSNGQARITDVNFSYPARLICPKYSAERCLHAYLLTYGGGLVAGDQIDLNVKVNGKDAWLFLLAQSATKIYRNPSASIDNIASSSPSVKLTTNSLRVTVQPGAVFCLLPEPVMPFRGSRYQQTQEFYLNLPPPLPQLNNESFCATSVADDVSRQWAEWPSVCVLDWQSAGRKSRGEIWQLDLFRSINRLFLVSTAADGNPLLLLLQDGLLLDRQQTNNSNSNSSVSNSSSGADSANNYWPEPFRYTLYPFTEFGTVLICGPHFSRLTDRLLQLAGRDNQPPPVNKPSSTAKEFIWCASPIETGGRVVGCFVRMASLDIRLMRGFISREIVEAVEQAAGEDSLFRRQR